MAPESVQLAVYDAVWTRVRDGDVAIAQSHVIPSSQMGLGAPTGQGTPTGVTDPAPTADQPQGQGQQTDSGAAAPAGLTNDQRLLQAAYTRTSQSSVAATKALGLPRDATPDQIAQAISDLRSAARTDDEGIEESPEMAQRRRALDERSWAVAQREYGDVVAERAQELYKALGGRGDPYEFVGAFAAAVMDVAQGSGNGANPQGQAQPTSQPGAQGGSIETPDLGNLAGGAPSDQRPNPADFKGKPGDFLSALENWSARIRGRQAT